MAIVQSTYLESQPIALPGMTASGDYSADSRTCETVAGIAFGVAVGRGTADNGAVIGGAAATDFLGVTIADKSIPYNGSTDAYARYDTMGVMTRGRIWVVVGADVTDGADVTFASTTGVLSSAAASGTQFAIAGARWMTTATNGSLALLHLGGALPSA